MFWYMEPVLILIVEVHDMFCTESLRKYLQVFRGL